MEGNKKKSKKCVYCGSFDEYYTKGLHRFEKTMQGHCSEHKKIVANNHSCDCWKTASYRYCFRKKVVSRALYEILMDISAIRQIYQEEKEEKENL